MPRVERIEDSRKLLARFNPSTQAVWCSKPAQCSEAEVPTLNEVGKQYGEQVAAAWLVPQLYNLSEFCGCKDKLTDSVLQETAQIIALHYRYMKLTELMLFFFQFKTGKYGRFYGSIDPMVIMLALRQYERERGSLLERLERQREDSVRQQRREGAVTREEYERLLEKYGDEAVCRMGR